VLSMSLRMRILLSFGFGVTLQVAKFTVLLSVPLSDVCPRVHMAGSSPVRGAAHPAVGAAAHLLVKCVAASVPLRTRGFACHITQSPYSASMYALYDERQSRSCQGHVSLCPDLAKSLSRLDRRC